MSASTVLQDTQRQPRWTEIEDVLDRIVESIDGRNRDSQIDKLLEALARTSCALRRFALTRLAQGIGLYNQRDAQLWDARMNSMPQLADRVRSLSVGVDGRWAIPFFARCRSIEALFLFRVHGEVFLMAKEVFAGRSLVGLHIHESCETELAADLIRSQQASVQYLTVAASTWQGDWGQFPSCPRLSQLGTVGLQAGEWEPALVGNTILESLSVDMPAEEFDVRSLPMLNARRTAISDEFAFVAASLTSLSLGGLSYSRRDLALIVEACTSLRRFSYSDFTDQAPSQTAITPAAFQSKIETIEVSATIEDAEVELIVSVLLRRRIGQCPSLSPLPQLRLVQFHGFSDDLPPFYEELRERAARHGLDFVLED